MIDPKQLRDLIVIPALKEIEKYSDAAVNLILGTIAQESHMGQYIKQIGRGPALGICQMEPATYYDIYNNYLIYQPELLIKIRNLYGDMPDERRLIYHLRYAVAMCRIHYLRVSEPLPAANDVIGMAEYWKRYYNTEQGAGSMDEFIDNYNRFVSKIAM